MVRGGGSRKAGATPSRGLLLAIGLALAVAAPAQEGTRYRGYLHDPPPPEEPELESVVTPPRHSRGLRDPAKPAGAGRRLERVRYCNERLFRDLNRCQATFGYGSPTYYRCEQRTVERSGAGCENRR